MLSVGLIGWRGMVGSVLVERMRQENDFTKINATFFSTSNSGGNAPDEANGRPLADAFNLDELKAQEVIVSCQGGDYTSEVYPKLRASGWNGYWIDAASTLRMDKDSVIVLDPANRNVIDRELNKGCKTFVGGNCTVSLMVMALGGLFREELVEWISVASYQAASGAGARNMIELMQQTAVLGDITKDALKDPANTALKLEQRITAAQNSSAFPIEAFGAPLAGSLIPWIDKAVDNGQTKEEWKGHVELNKILATATPITVDGICCRVGALRCHSQAVLIKLNRKLEATEAEKIIASGNDWVKVVPNNKEATLAQLTPAATSGSMQVPIGRIHNARFGQDYLAAFTVGDQLLWGAAEPLRRMLEILRG